MRHPSTGDSRPPGQPAEEATDARTGRRSDTQPDVDGAPAPRLPHERDESSDAGRAGPGAKIRQAQQDVESGKLPTDRGEATEEVYRENLRDVPPGSVRKGE